MKKYEINKKRSKTRPGETLIFHEEITGIHSSLNHIQFYATGSDGSGTNYFYTLELTYKDLAKIIESLDITQNNSLKDALSNSTKSLFRLLMLSSNISEVLEKEDNEN